MFAVRVPYLSRRGGSLAVLLALRPDGSLPLGCRQPRVTVPTEACAGMQLLLLSERMKKILERFTW